MTELNRALIAAAEQGIISLEQVNDLEAHLSSYGGKEGMSGIARAAGFQVAADGRAAEDSEQPRFVRGFHDILITIGVVVVMIGLWGVGGAYAALPVIIVLAEVLVQRQRLALPAVALTLALVHWIALQMLHQLQATQWVESAQVLAFFCAFPLALWLFYWRYRVPLSLALLLLSVAGIAVGLVFYLMETVFGIDPGLDANPYLAPGILLAAAMAVFTVAMRFDISDPQRLTSRSDIAFWLHLAAAPALLYATLGIVMVAGNGAALWSGETGLGRAAAVMGLVALFMVIGVVIDRRAFVTSGLLSLGGAVWVILDKSGASLGSYFFVVFVIVGVIVLVIGICWQWLRRMMLNLLPIGITARLRAP